MNKKSKKYNRKIMFEESTVKKGITASNITEKK